MLRKTTSLTLLLSGVPVIITSIILFVGPPTHIAHFSDWRVLGLTKCQWNALHVATGFLFAITMVFHAYFNRKPILTYLRNRASVTVVFTRPFALALILTVYVCLGALWRLPPVGQFLGLARTIKIAHMHEYGAPPYGQAEDYPLQNIAGYLGWDAKECLSNLRAKGIVVDSLEQSISGIARRNEISTSMVLGNMRPDNENTSGAPASHL